MLILFLCHNAWDHRDGHLQLPPNLAECQILRQHRRPWLITGNADAQRTARWHSQRHQNSEQHSCQAGDSPVYMKCPVHRHLEVDYCDQSRVRQQPDACARTNVALHFVGHCVLGSA